MGQRPTSQFASTILVSVLSCQGLAYAGAQAGLPPLNEERLDASSDLSLSDWGPYTKDYIGISHISSEDEGVRFDVSVFPGYYRRATFVPNVLFESGFHPWRAAPDLSFYTFRHDIEWKDEVYADISYAADGDRARVVEVEFVNNTEVPQSLSLHLAASMHFPSVGPYKPNEPIIPSEVFLPRDGVWVDALDYTELIYAVGRPDDNLVYDGWLRGEVKDHGFVNGSGIGRGFGGKEGDRASFSVQLPAKVEDPVILVRYRNLSQSIAHFGLSGSLDTEVALPPCHDFCVETAEVGKSLHGQFNFEVRSLGSNSVELDGFAILSENSVNEIRFEAKEWSPEPERRRGPVEKSLVLRYEDAETVYGLRWFHKSFQVREIHHSSLSGFYERIANDHVRESFEGDSEGHYTNLYIRPINMSPSHREKHYLVVVQGTEREVERALTAYENEAALKKFVTKARQRLPDLDPIKAGTPYRFGVEKLAATLATNIVYPVYTQQQFIRHSAPGRWWDSLYTWDSGFIGLGMLELDPLRSLENLNAYLTPEGAQSAFIHHGTPLPVQHYQFLELWNRTQSREAAAYAYPKLKRYFKFLVGAESSSTDIFNSGLLQTWDYFYNSGGWDDLPPQKYVHDEDLTSSVSPVVTTSHAIRVAKILRHMAQVVDAESDISFYDQKITSLARALQRHSWDKESGYFGYVVHDEAGDPVDILRTEEGANFNQTLDGASPLVAGVTTPKQTDKILKRLKSTDRLFSSIGLTAVDQSASYYRHDGYWNGTVWMPHQWFFWKRMLDLGEEEFAQKIAMTALKLWKRETELTYNSPEHFVIETGRGAGWQQFGALSAPILSWYAAYFMPGRLTVGLDTLVERAKFSPTMDQLEAKLSIESDRARGTMTALVTLSDQHDYRATWNGESIKTKTYNPGSLAVTIPVSQGGTLVVKPKPRNN